MSLSEEKLLVLKMLEEGKITGEEAAKLLEALDNGNKQHTYDNFSKQQKQANFHEEAAKIRDKMHDWKKEFKNNYNQKDFDRMVDDFSSKAEKLGKNLASTTYNIVDKMVDFVGSFVDTNVFNIFGNFPTLEKNYQINVSEGFILEIEGTNGMINVKKHLENTILIKSRIKSPVEKAESIIEFNQTGNTATLKLSKEANKSVSHEVFLPAVKFGKIKLETSNGRIYVEDSLSAELEVITKNSHIELMGVNCDKISAHSKNARIQVNYTIGKEVEITSNNAAIDIKHIKADHVTATTSNGRILVENVQNNENSPEVNLILKTSNSGIKVNMNDLDNKGYKIKAKTTNGGINLLVPELTYHNVNKPGLGGSFVEAESAAFNTASEKIILQAETTNGYIEVVK